MSDDNNRENQIRDATYTPTVVWRKLVNALLLRNDSRAQKQASKENFPNYSRPTEPETPPPTDAVPPEGEKALAPEYAHDLALVAQGLAAVETRLSSLQDIFEQRLRYDDAKEQAFNVLYEKMRQYEGDYQASLKKSLVLSLLLLYDNIQKVEMALDEQPDVQKFMTGLRQQLLDILYTEDVEPMGDLGDMFDHQWQQAINTVPTSNLEKDKTIEQVVREGFFSGRKVLRPQSVTVRKYQTFTSQE